MKQFIIHHRAAIVAIMNLLGLAGISLIVAATFIFTFVFKEHPCPLCLLQRLGLLTVGFGFLLNIRYMDRSRHYVLSLLASIATACVALRQIVLHIAPGNIGYGSTIFGLHMYTWVFILCMILALYVTALLGFSMSGCLHHSQKDKVPGQKTKIIKLLANFFFAFYIATITVNAMLLM